MRLPSIRTRGPRAPDAYRLPTRLARALERLAPGIILSPRRGTSWAEVVAQAERWLGLLPGPARVRVVRLLHLLEWAPLLRGLPALSRMGPEQVRRYVAGPLAAPRGFWATLGRVRQVVRLAYYADPRTHAALGFVAPAQRPIDRRQAALPEAAATTTPSAAGAADLVAAAGA